MGACAECQQNCAFLHCQHYPGPAVTSFFKIMISDEFMHTLYLPPQFAKATSHLADQEIYLEDSVGIKSKAKVSKWENTLAIQQEWHQFSLSHNIERGDFLVFHYFTRPVDHFVVHIYGRSGCLKNDFDTTPIERSNKRARTANMSLRPEYESNNSNNDKAFIPCTLGGETQGIKVNAANKESPATLGNNDYQPLASRCAPNPIIDEGHNKRKESCLRSVDEEVRNDPPSSFTMSKNELCCKSPSDENLKSQENELMGVQGAIPSRLEMPTGKLLDRNFIFIGETESVEDVQGKENSVKNKAVTESFMPHVMKKGLCTSSVQHISQFGGAFGNGEKGNLIQKEPTEMVTEGGKLKSQENEGVQLGPKGALPSRFELPTSKLRERKIIFLDERESMEHVQGKDNSVKDKPISESPMPHVIKMGPCTSSIQMPITQFGGAFGNGEKAKLIKKEPAEMVTEEENLMNMTNMDFESVKSEPVDAASADLCLVLVDGAEFVELPESWPWRDRQQDKGILFLTDPTKRVWPVLLHRKQHIVVLSTGWKEFSAANMLKPGDECVFRALKRREYIVDIRRKGE
ncbi:unnamed protein product [Cuscuta campestris]|uniref:TF-B3 domain-containing protein n=1 Tax=Cuscuta campestris TaxID=132261 RepID=A0A484LAA2_9ASTE|nr:unnamed protein product [Cuscuta campestris]